ncbi:MAG TPA: heparan-alpha-glucosaminide N-acetyltransferase [Rhodoblastus sp.]|nr:heparan-alpha-glucosaminide N-acetyltransferase [Rhodoblastus sp.]
MLAPAQAAETPRGRIAALDMARGAALVAMFAYHLTWDLADFDYIDARAPFSPQMRLFSHVIACAFLFIAGLSLALARRDPFDWFGYRRRIALIAGAAALVTAASWFLFPQAIIFFGILHCIAAASVLALPFVFLPWPAALAAGVALFALPFFVQSPAFDAPALIWTGLGVRIPTSNDFRPLLPWAGALLVGLGVGLFTRDRGGFDALRRIPGTSLPARLLAFGGRHSLAVYLIHQPVFFALLSASVWAFGPPAPADEQPFRRSCEAQCLSNGAGAKQCRRGCACTAQTLKRLHLWDRLRAGVLDDGEKALLTRVARDCIGR